MGQRPQDDVSGTSSEETVLVLVLALDADARFRAVLDRIPDDVLRSPLWRFVVIDDGTEGRAGDVARAWAAERRVASDRVRVLDIPVGLGYGGVQKVALRYAVDRRFGTVIVLPGDGQYRPEDLPRFAARRRETGIDVVLGVRASGRASQGGVPGPWRLPAKAVSWVQSRLAGGGVSDFHSGFRAYGTSFLARVPFELGAEGWEFDTDLLLQAMFVGAGIAEVPVEVDYAKRIRRDARIPYARASLRSALQFRMHRWGMFCSLKYRHLGRLRYVDKGSVTYSSHAAALRVVRERAPATLVDLGCGPGFVAERCRDLGVRVTGIDALPPLPGKMDEFHRADLDTHRFPVDPFSYDLVLMLDVIEHLSDPEGFLLELRNSSRSILRRSPRATLVLSTPNVAFAAVRLNLLRGSFNYAERGILDVGHRRLFTRKTLLAALRECGYTVERVVPVGVPFEAVFSGAWARAAGAVGRALAWIWPTMFAFQFLVVCHPLPGMSELIPADDDERARPG